MKSVHPTSITLVVALAIAAFVGFQVVSGVMEYHNSDYMNESAEWCEDHNGELVNSNVFGSHGGLHCDLPNGTSVHMSDVIGQGETE